MLITLTAFLAAGQALPQIDRTALELQARAEALAPRNRRAGAPARTPSTRTASRNAAIASRTRAAETRKPAPQPVRTAAVRTQTLRPGPAARQIAPGPSRQTRTVSASSAAQRRNQPRRAYSGGPLDLASITTICRAAGNQEDPAGFIARLSTAYSLSSADSTSLRASCAAYLAGRADARRSSGGTY
jgi:hypothetical protein